MAKSTRNTIELKLIRGNHRISNSTKPDIELYKKLVKEGSEREEIKKPGLLISRLDHPVDVAYDERTIRLSPRAKLKVADIDKLGELSQGVFLKKIFKNQPVPEKLLEEKTMDLGEAIEKVLMPLAKKVAEKKAKSKRKRVSKK